MDKLHMWFELIDNVGEEFDRLSAKVISTLDCAIETSQINSILDDITTEIEGVL